MRVRSKPRIPYANSKSLQTKVSLEEYNKIKYFADLKGLSMSAWLCDNIWFGLDADDEGEPVAQHGQHRLTTPANSKTVQTLIHTNTWFELNRIAKRRKMSLSAWLSEQVKFGIKADEDWQAEEKALKEEQRGQGTGTTG